MTDPEKHVLSGMIRRGDCVTSIAAAESILNIVSGLRHEIYELLSTKGPMTDEELEKSFTGYGPSTVRKRRSELYHLGLLETAGTRINKRHRPMFLWRPKWGFNRQIGLL